ncbi:hypothetical protein HG531_000523 [Fusarium graminearum]|nr:hypothetical protein HG531_000523 [Fusarium graminearum]
MGCSGSKSALSANNSHGASIAAVELSIALGNTFSNVKEQLRELLQRLDHEASKYVNSKVDEVKSPDWHPSQAEVQLISAAWKCARGTYNLGGTIANTSYCTFRREETLRGSYDGTVKVITSTVIEKTPEDVGESDLLPVLVLAIRGSANESAKFSCVTFGAPPCVTTSVDLSFYQPGGKTICLNIFNEFDFVTRADKPYILSLVEVARNMLNQPRKPLLPEPETSSEIIDASLKATQDKEAELSSPKNEESHDQGPKTWKFSQPLYNHIGPSVVLLMRSENEMKLTAVEVTPAEFQKLLFCRTAVHGKRIYEQRVEALEQGHFNDRLGW